MNKVAIRVENLSKLYRLGEVGTGTISHDLNRWWARMRGKEDPYAVVGQINDRTQKSKPSSPHSPILPFTQREAEYVYALKDINFEVQQGEVLGIIGKNGAGKSTLLKLLSKITAPSTGSIKARGRIASLLEVGTGMHPEMTGIENVYLNGTILGMTRREISDKLDDILDFAGCAKYADTPVKRYSSGMKVRLGFAVAAFLEPEILIVDEVLAVGDAEFQKRAIGKMHDISRGGGRTVLFVSHNMASVSALCSRSVILKNGEMFYEGETSDAIDKYLACSDVNSDNGLLIRDEKSKQKDFFFNEVQFIQADNPVKTAISGKKMAIDISYNSILNRDTEIDISIGFFTMEGTFLFACRSGVINKFLKINESRKFSCIIPKLPLKEGAYKCNIIAYHKGQVIDHVVDAVKLDVEAGDFYGSGKLIAKGRSGVLVNYEWISETLIPMNESKSVDIR